MKPESLSIAEARKLALHSQCVLTSNKTGRAIDATFNAINHLGYVQIDTISVVERAHHHTLWNRNLRYRPNHLDRLQQQDEIFEYWAHAAAYLPINSYRFCLPNMQAIASGRKLWFKCDPKIKRKVLERIKIEGPLRSKDFEHGGKTNLPMWEWKPAKYALEQLFMEGQLMVVRRDKFQKVYDLTERVLPDDVNTTLPTDAEFCQSLIVRYLNSHGLGNATEIAYLRPGLKPQIQQQLSQLQEDERALKVRINDADYYVDPVTLTNLTKPIPRSRLKILSPFDNLVIQRNRIKHLFDFDYQIECYVPQAKRRHGYFCLPILWNADLVARMDCKADRQSNTLIIRGLVLESKLKRVNEFGSALVKELNHFMTFNNCAKLLVDDVSNASVKRSLQAMNPIALG